MDISESLLKRLAKEIGALPNPAEQAELDQLRKFNAEGDALTYFACYNFFGEKDLVTLDDAGANIEMMEEVTPNCEVWQHRFLPFARDFEGRIYCFNQNARDAAGNSPVVRLQYTFGDETNAEEISAASEFIAPDISSFIALFLDSKLDKL